MAEQLNQEMVKCLIPKRMQVQETIRRYQNIDKILLMRKKRNFAKQGDVNKMYRRQNKLLVLRKDRQGIYAQLKGDEVKIGDKIITGGQQNLSNGALVIVSDKEGVGTTQPASKTNL